MDTQWRSAIDSTLQSTHATLQRLQQRHASFDAARHRLHHVLRTPSRAAAAADMLYRDKENDLRYSVTATSTLNNNKNITNTTAETKTATAEGSSSTHCIDGNSVTPRATVSTAEDAHSITMTSPSALPYPATHVAAERRHALRTARDGDNDRHPRLNRRKHAYPSNTSHTTTETKPMKHAVDDGMDYHDADVVPLPPPLHVSNQTTGAAYYRGSRRGHASSPHDDMTQRSPRHELPSGRYDSAPAVHYSHDDEQTSAAMTAIRVLQSQLSNLGSELELERTVRLDSTRELRYAMESQVGELRTALQQLRHDYDALQARVSEAHCRMARWTTWADATTAAPSLQQQLSVPLSSSSPASLPSFSLTDAKHTDSHRSNINLNHGSHQQQQQQTNLSTTIQAEADAILSPADITDTLSLLLRRVEQLERQGGVSAEQRHRDDRQSRLDHTLGFAVTTALAKELVKVRRMATEAAEAAVESMIERKSRSAAEAAAQSAVQTTVRESAELCLERCADDVRSALRHYREEQGTMHRSELQEMEQRCVGQMKMLVQHAREEQSAALAAVATAAAQQQEQQQQAMQEMASRQENMWRAEVQSTRTQLTAAVAASEATLQTSVSNLARRQQISAQEMNDEISCIQSAVTAVRQSVHVCQEGLRAAERDEIAGRAMGEARLVSLENSVSHLSTDLLRRCARVEEQQLLQQAQQDKQAKEQVQQLHEQHQRLLLPHQQQQQQNQHQQFQQLQEHKEEIQRIQAQQQQQQSALAELRRHSETRLSEWTHDVHERLHEMEKWRHEHEKKQQLRQQQQEKDRLDSEQQKESEQQQRLRDNIDTLLNQHQQRQHLSCAKHCECALAQEREMTAQQLQQLDHRICALNATIAALPTVSASPQHASSDAVMPADWWSAVKSEMAEVSSAALKTSMLRERRRWAGALSKLRTEFHSLKSGTHSGAIHDDRMSPSDYSDDDDNDHDDEDDSTEYENYGDGAVPHRRTSVEMNDSKLTDDEDDVGGANTEKKYIDGEEEQRMREPRRRRGPGRGNRLGMRHGDDARETAHFSSLQKRLATLEKAVDTGFTVTADTLSTLRQRLRRCMTHASVTLQQSAPPTLAAAHAQPFTDLDEVFVFLVTQVCVVYTMVVTMQESAVATLDLVQQQEGELLAIAPLQRAFAHFTQHVKPVAAAVGVDPSLFDIELASSVYTAGEAEFGRDGMRASMPRGSGLQNDDEEGERSGVSDEFHSSAERNSAT